MDRAKSLNDRMLPFGVTLGLRVIAAEAGHVRGAGLVEPRFATRSPTAHGGFLIAMADNLAGLGSGLDLAPGWRTVTLESKTNFLSAAPVGGTVFADAVRLHAGRTTELWQTILTHDGRDVARVLQTQLKLAPDR